MSFSMTEFVIIIIVLTALFSWLSYRAKPRKKIASLDDVDWDALQDERVMRHLPEARLQAIKMYQALTDADSALATLAVDYLLQHPEYITDD